MSKLKATKKGKAGKHRGLDTLGLLKVRALRKARVMTVTDQLLLERVFKGDSDDSEGPTENVGNQIQHII